MPSYVEYERVVLLGRGWASVLYVYYSIVSVYIYIYFDTSDR